MRRILASLIAVFVCLSAFGQAFTPLRPFVFASASGIDPFCGSPSQTVSLYWADSSPGPHTAAFSGSVSSNNFLICIVQNIHAAGIHTISVTNQNGTSFTLITNLIWNAFPFDYDLQVYTFSNTFNGPFAVGVTANINDTPGSLIMAEFTNFVAGTFLIDVANTNAFGGGGGSHTSLVTGGSCTPTHSGDFGLGVFAEANSHVNAVGNMQGLSGWNWVAGTPGASFGADLLVKCLGSASAQNATATNNAIDSFEWYGGMTILLAATNAP